MILNTYLGCARYHVLDKVPVAWSVNDGDVVLGGLKLPKRNVNRNTTFSLSF
jgi:hypothetical protein